MQREKATIKTSVVRGQTGVTNFIQLLLTNLDGSATEHLFSFVDSRVADVFDNMKSPIPWKSGKQWQLTLTIDPASWWQWIERTYNGFYV